MPQTVIHFFYIIRIVLSFCLVETDDYQRFILWFLNSYFSRPKCKSLKSARLSGLFLAWGLVLLKMFFSDWFLMNFWEFFDMGGCSLLISISTEKGRRYEWRVQRPGNAQFDGRCFCLVWLWGNVLFLDCWRPLRYADDATRQIFLIFDDRLKDRILSKSISSVAVYLSQIDWLPFRMGVVL